MRLPPMKMTPAFRFGAMTPWGGSGLRWWGKDIPDPRTGESLEVSVLPGLESSDAQGTPLSELLRRYGTDMRGTQVGEEFPLLLKLISADELLSVQVHPGDDYARMHEDGKLGKSEAWVILEAGPHAEIVYGVREGVTREALAEACAQGGEAIKACLNFVRVKAGEVYYIPAGMIHALGDGITLMEIQQSSDVTYRFYDWDRRDANGKSRELHVQKGLAVIDTGLRLNACHGVTRAAEGAEITTFVDGPAFTLQRWDVARRMALEATPEHFRLLVALCDTALICGGERMALCAGDTVFLPANMERAALEAGAQVLLCW